MHPAAILIRKLCALLFGTGRTSSPTELVKYPKDSTIEARSFVVRNFVVGTASAVFASLKVEGSVIKVIMRDHDSPVHALSVHPTLDLIAVGGMSGLLRVWNYVTMLPTASRYFDKGNMVRSCCFDPSGLYLAVGFANGVLRMLDSATLKDVLKEPFTYAKAAVTQIAFSHDSQLCAYVVEYDLNRAREDYLPLSSVIKIEQSSVPLCMTWYPAIEKEEFLCVANSDFKLKLFNSTTKMCRRTLLAPMYGSPIQKLSVLPNPSAHEGREWFLTYTIKDKVGLILLPLNGNPYHAMTMIDHPDGVGSVGTSRDGKFVFTTGTKDGAVHIWAVHTEVLEAQAKLGGDGIAPFYQLIEGGKDGAFFAELKDYFYYAMIRSQGIDTMSTRQVSLSIPISEIPFVMRAIGYYPTEEEIESMMNEIKFSKYLETGQYVTEIGLETFLQMYVNHRPVSGIPLDMVRWAFKHLATYATAHYSHRSVRTGGSGKGSGGRRGQYGDRFLRPSTGDADHSSDEDDDGNQYSLSREDLIDLIEGRGEHMTEYEIAEYLTTLLGFNPEGGSIEQEQFDPSTAGNVIESNIPQMISSNIFVQKILGMMQAPARDPTTSSSNNGTNPVSRAISNAQTQTAPT